MPATYDSIITVTLGSDLSTFNIDNIPGTYTDLIIISEAIPVTNDDRNIGMRFNSDAGTNYSDQELYALSNGTLGAQGIAFNTLHSVARAIGFGQSAVDPGKSVITTQIMSYSNTNFFKTIISQGSRNSYGTSTTIGTWRNTSAITSITIFSGSPQSIKAGSKFSLYGIRAA